ncbi:uncharacterized protein [Euwallacea similis]|uniref:uncharacterized protein n=1 Tax=Euwallacea similis TaxID=1736056 RepID=UPI00344B1A2C
MYKFLCFWIFVGLVQGGFFDLTDVDDPFALLWNFQPIRDKFTNCSVGEVSGVCMEKAKCLIAGGTIIKKTCGPFFTCCSLKSQCGKVSDKKQGYFSSELLNPTTTNCHYKINLRNKNVCQVRLDFEELILAPTIAFYNRPIDAKVLACINDSLIIKPKSYGLPIVCGNSTKQHLYVHVNQTLDSTSAVNIHIKLDSRLGLVNNDLPSPKWKIKFTQLECPLKRHKFNIFKYGDVDNINNDFYALAPHGAIQYFTEETGQFRSFALSNAKNTIGGYPYGLHYTIAFRRPSSASCIKFHVITAELLQPSSIDSDCVDYLNVPEYYTYRDGTSVPKTSEICTFPSYFYSLMPGPFFVNFKSRQNIDSVDEYKNYGFTIDYEVSTKECPHLVN